MTTVRRCAARARRLGVIVKAMWGILRGEGRLALKGGNKKLGSGFVVGLSARFVTTDVNASARSVTLGCALCDTGVTLE